MSRGGLADAWNRFFFEPQSTLPLAVFRILYGGAAMATLGLLKPDWLAWYGAHAWVSLETMQQMEPGTRLNLFAVIPQSDGWIEGLFWAALGAAACLTLGLLTRLSSVALFVCLASIDQRNLYITHGGDTFLRVAGFFLMFAPAGELLSVDRAIGLWRGKEGAAQERSPWAQRMIQFELALVYVTAFWWKAEGGAWRDGSALYYVYHVADLRRFPLPEWFLRPAVLRWGTWGALAVEGCWGILVWIRRLRYYVLAAGLALHLAIEYSLNVPMFEWDILAAYVLFVEAEDLKRAGRWMARQGARVRGS